MSNSCTCRLAVGPWPPAVGGWLLVIGPVIAVAAGRLAGQWSSIPYSFRNRPRCSFNPTLSLKQGHDPFSLTLSRRLAVPPAHAPP